MLVNKKDIASFNAKLIDRTITSNEVVTINDWLDGAIQPTFIRQQEKFKQISIKLLVEANSEMEAAVIISNLNKEFKYAEIVFKDIPSFTYKVFLSGVTTPNRLRQGVFEVEYNLKSGYGMGAEKIVSRQSGYPAQFEEYNTGTAETPCVIEITPTVNFVTLTLEGFTDKSITVKNLVSGQKVVIDGEQNTITVGGKDNFSNYDAWAFPSLLPGKNLLKVSTNTGYNMVIKYKPRYL